MIPYSETARSSYSRADPSQSGKKTRNKDNQGHEPIASMFVNPRRGCNCKKSMCIKLYCECYASGVYCNGCNCRSCLNNPENEKHRKSAINNTLEKNPTAFQPKITSSIADPKFDKMQSTPRHNKGCSCKKSGCLKKYCECYQAGIPCTEICKCINCRNRAVFTNNPGKSFGQGNESNQAMKQSQKINYPKSSLKSNKFLYTIFLPGEDFSTKLDEEFKKANLIKKDLVSDTLGKLITIFNSDVKGLLGKRETCEDIGREFQESTPTKKLITQTLPKCKVETDVKKEPNPVNDDDLACDEEFNEEKQEQIMKETPKEDQITEYKIKKYLILKGFIDILSKIDGNIPGGGGNSTSNGQEMGDKVKKETH